MIESNCLYMNQIVKLRFNKKVTFIAKFIYLIYKLIYTILFILFTMGMVTNTFAHTYELTLDDILTIDSQESYHIELLISMTLIIIIRVCIY